jgi:hypothetical protein
VCKAGFRQGGTSNTRNKQKEKTDSPKIIALEYNRLNYFLYLKQIKYNYGI